MAYLELLNKLYGISLHRRIKLGLEHCHQLDYHLHFPSRAFPTIHVAGTNGKGSVVTKIAKALEFSGLKVGLYTSPHLSCFRERIKINGQMIPEEQVQLLLTQIFAITEQENIPATFFEMTTLLALAYFAQEKVDIAVIETGLGGRLDATNIVHPQLTVITSISLDHTDILGTTVEEISLEKAGIIKHNTPLVIGPRVPLHIIEDIAKKNRSHCYQVNGNFDSFEAENRAVAKQCLEMLKVPEQAIEKGIEALPPCRMEIIQKNSSPTVILDVAHNPDGISYLMKSIQVKFPNRPIRAICGFSKSKDVMECLRILKPFIKHLHPVEANSERALSLEEFHEYLLNAGITPTSNKPTISETVSYALAEARKSQEFQELVLICGSFFIMSEAREALGIIEPKDPLNLNEIFITKQQSNHRERERSYNF